MSESLPPQCLFRPDPMEPPSNEEYRKTAIAAIRKWLKDRDNIWFYTMCIERPAQPFLVGGVGVIANRQTCHEHRFEVRLDAWPAVYAQDQYGYRVFPEAP